MQTSADHKSSGHLFVSYASDDRDRVLPVIAALEAAGVPVWFDRAGIPGGESYAAAIGEAMRSCRAMLLICTNASFASRNVRQEIALAWKYERPIVPLRLENVEPTPELEYWLEGAQWIDAVGDGRGWKPSLLRALARVSVSIVHVDDPPEVDSSQVQLDLAPLPLPLTGLIGRANEVEQTLDALSLTRLVTLSGPGGVGKTRLALEIARAASARFPDGVAFVNLAAVSDPAMLLSTLAEAIGVHDAGDRPIRERLIRVLRNAQTLLLVDNFEHVMASAQELAELLSSCERLRILVTSRVPLRLRGERIVAVDPLGLVEQADEADSATSPAVSLFVARAKEAQPSFALTDQSRVTVRQICRRLDGLPLAIELAAARLTIYTPDELLDRLDHASRVLVTGPRDLPERQQTLERAIAWSYDLLSPAQQRLFRTVGVFSGGAAAKEIAIVLPEMSRDELAIELAALAESSLLRCDDGESGRRYTMLETVLQFAIERLERDGEAAAARGAHAKAILWAAARLESEVAGEHPQRAIRRLRGEYGNILAALEWLESQGNYSGLAELLIASDTIWYEHLSERRSWHDRCRPSELPPSIRAAELVRSASIANQRSDFAASIELAERSLQVLSSHPESLTIGWALNVKACALEALGRNPEAIEAARAAVDVALEHGDHGLGAMARCVIAEVLARSGEVESSEEMFDLAQMTVRDMGFWLWICYSTRALMCAQRGEITRAGLYWKQVLQGFWQSELPIGVAGALAGIADLSCRDGLLVQQGARIAGAADALVDKHGGVIPISSATQTPTEIGSRMHEVLGESEFASLRNEGRQWSTDRAFVEALSLVDEMLDQYGAMELPY